MKNILVVIDMQNDFIRGSLSAFDAESIIPGIVQEITKRKPNDVLFTKDTHHNDYLNTSEGKHLPVVHCVENMYMLKEMKGRDGHPFLSGYLHHVISYDAKKQWV